MKVVPLIAALAALGFSMGAAAAVVDVEVSQKGRSFQPDSVDIKAGDVVRIQNDDDYTHNVYVKSGDFNFDSEEQPPGKRQDIRFTVPGDFVVLCHIHPKMKLMVHVK